MQVRDFNIAENVEDIGFYAGFIGKNAINTIHYHSVSLSFIGYLNSPCSPNKSLIQLVGASFMIGRALTSVFWGIVADRYGRKPVILFGIFIVLVAKRLYLLK